MAGCINKSILVGHVGKDPVIRRTQAGKAIANFSVATSESWTDKQTGERKEDVSWHQVVVFNEGLAGVVEKYVKKGSRIYVEGASKTRKFQDQNGQDRWVTEVVLQGFGASLVLLDGKERSDGDSRSDHQAPISNGSGHAYEPGAYETEEIPF